MVLGLFPGIMWHLFDLPPSTCPPPPTERLHSPSRRCFFVFTIPALLHFLHPPQSSIWFRPACVPCLHILEWNWRQEHGVVSHLIPPACVHCACVCVTATWVYSHTPFQRVGWMLMILLLNAKKGLSCSSTICCCREFAFPHTKQLCSSHESIKLLPTALDHHSATTKHNILF